MIGRWAALAVLALLCGCATRRTLDELGQPALARALPEKVTIVSRPGAPRIEGWKGDEPDARWDFRPNVQVQSWREGDDVIVDVRVFALGNDQIERAALAAHPLPLDRVAAYAQGGRVDDPEHPLCAALSTRRLDDGCHELAVKFPRTALAGAPRIALPTLIVFEHGGVIVTFAHAAAPE